ncbi:MAG: LuxR C-terminal-related transcriptional regulator [Anaerolineales bacterium]
MPLLATKLHAPQLRPQLVPRTRLLNQLRAEGGTLTVIAAPAGFGKTTLITAWLAQDQRPHAWLSLEERDNDPSRFVNYLIAAFQTLVPTFGQTILSALQALQSPDPEAIITPLVNEIATAGTSFTLVLDDYHVITNPYIQAGLTLLVEHLPPQLHLILTTRADPPLPLPRLRARGLLTEIRADDLRFTHAEAAVFLNEIMGLALTSEDVAALETRTEGWAAGLQLAALSLQKHTDHAGFVRNLNGTHRYILDYLADEVLNRQPEDIRQFLYQTSILERLSGDLCNAVTGRTDSQHILEYLESANLFIVPLDDERRWYRYHHLFGELLAHRFAPCTPAEAVHAAHLRAAEWFRENGSLPDAIYHALCAEDFEYATPLIERAGMEMLMKIEIRTLSDWLAQLPEALFQSRPWLNVIAAWMRYIQAANPEELLAIEARLHQAEQTLNHAERPTELLGYMMTLRAYIAQTRDNHPETVRLSHEALARLPADNLVLRSILTMNLATTYLIQGDIQPARQYFEETQALGKAAGNIFTVFVSRDHLATLAFEAGQVRQAEAMLHEAIRLATDANGRPLSYVGLYKVELAEIYREWNRLDEAVVLLEQAYEFRYHAQFNDLDTVSHLVWARVLAAKGDAPGGLAKLAQIEDNLRKRKLTVFLPWLEAVKALLYLVDGNLAEARRWADTWEANLVSVASLRRYPGEYATYVKIRTAESNPNVFPLLDQMLHIHTTDRRMRRVIETRALLAIAHVHFGNTATALTHLEEALRLANPEGYTRTFLDEGAPMAVLLAQCKPSPTRDALLQAFDPPVLRSTPHALHPDPLTDREVQILRLIAAGLSNQEIADELYLTASTVKWYSHQIYQKLGAKRRTEAVEKARGLGVV